MVLLMNGYQSIYVATAHLLVHVICVTGLRDHSRLHLVLVVLLLLCHLLLKVAAVLLGSEQAIHLLLLLVVVLPVSLIHLKVF